MEAFKKNNLIANNLVQNFSTAESSKEEGGDGEDESDETEESEVSCSGSLWFRDC
jgi:hypothetical protein